MPNTLHPCPKSSHCEGTPRPRQSAFSSAPPSAGRSRGLALPWHGRDALFAYRPRPRPEPNISPHKKTAGHKAPPYSVSKRLAEFASADAKSYNHFLSPPVRERKYLSGCQCEICPSLTDKLCAQQTASLLSEKPGGFSDSLSGGALRPAASRSNYTLPSQSVPFSSKYACVWRIFFRISSRSLLQNSSRISLP